MADKTNDISTTQKCIIMQIKMIDIAVQTKATAKQSPKKIPAAPQALSHKKVLVSQRRYERACKRIADVNEPFCERGAATEHMKNTHAKRGYFKCSVVCCDVEAPPRFELGNKAFAELCLTSWLWRRIYLLYYIN